MPVYRVKPGVRHGPFDKYGPGDLVEHTEAEAAGFLDKLELVEEAPPAPDPEDTIAESHVVEAEVEAKAERSTPEWPIALEREDDLPETETAEVEESEIPEPDFTVEGHTIQQVLEAVDEGLISPSEAMDQELLALKPRQTLLSALEKLG